MRRGARKLFLFFFQNVVIRAKIIVVSFCEYSNDCEWRVQKSLELVPRQDDDI